MGRTANVLFGVCDNTDADYLYTKVRKLEGSNSQIFQLEESRSNIIQFMMTNVNSSLIELEGGQNSLFDKYAFLLREARVDKLHLGILNFKTVVADRLSLLNIITQYRHETKTKYWLL